MANALTAQLGEFAAETRFSDVSDAARLAAKNSLLHITTGMAAGYARGLGHKALGSVMASVNGIEEATVIGNGRRIPAMNAAMINGATARALNLDDHFDQGVVHPSAATIGAALAAGERKGTMSGADLVTAIAIGNEITCRLAESVVIGSQGTRQGYGWFQAMAFGLYGATAASARLTGLDAAGVHNALGTALFSGSGTLEAFSATAQTRMMRGMTTGFTAQGAVMAALMSEAGITGVPEPLEGSWGFFKTYYSDKYDAASITDGLGSRWVSEQVAIKPFPTCRWTHAYIDSVIRLVTRENVDPADIAELRLHLSGFVTSRCVPIDRQRAPENFNHAGHALPFLLAAAARRRRLSISDLLDAESDAETRALAARVVPVQDERYGHDDSVGPAYVEITLRDGRVIGHETFHALGSPGLPLSREQRLGCARENLMLADCSPTDADALFDRFDRIEDEPDAMALIRQATTPSA